MPRDIRADFGVPPPNYGRTSGPRGPSPAPPPSPPTSRSWLWILAIGAIIFFGAQPAWNFASDLLRPDATQAVLVFPDYMSGLLDPTVNKNAEWAPVHAQLYPAQPGVLRPDDAKPILVRVTAGGKAVRDAEVRFQIEPGVWRTARTDDDGVFAIDVPRSPAGGPDHSISVEVPSGKGRTATSVNGAFRVISDPPGAVNLRKEGWTEGRSKIRLTWDVSDGTATGPVTVFGIFSPAFFQPRWEFLQVVPGGAREAAVEPKLGGSYMVCAFNGVGYGGCGTVD